MLTIREEQMETLKDAPLNVFHSEMLAHCCEFSPPLFATLDEVQALAFVRRGCKRAFRYGINQRGPVRLYLELMMIFGSAFDDDPQYGWAAEILRDIDPGTQMARAKSLYGQALEYRERVAGPEDEYVLSALRAVAAAAERPPQIGPDGFAAGMVAQMSRMYPEKYAYVGEPGLHRLVGEAMALAAELRFQQERQVGLIVVLMFAFGHGFASDPLYPWIARTLHDDRIPEPEKRATHLERRALTWVRQIIERADRGPTE